MTIASALLAELTDDDMALLAKRLAPYLPAQQMDDGWLKGAEEIAAYLHCKVSRVYGLSSAKRIPVEHEGGLTVRKSVLDAWVRAGGGKRP